MLRCKFHLNSQSLSNLSCPGVGFFPAYSGVEGNKRNNPGFVTTPNEGPLPPGKYYIVDRPKGYGSAIKDYLSSQVSGSDRNVWFALYREDDTIDDHTFIEHVQRGAFRLHPAGYAGISKGCITLPSKEHFITLRSALLASPPVMVGASLMAYGTVQVY
ncbi:DUF2778 domain-containing protein [Cronobacter dublinensis]|nr:DUF2778 domain-containing protein [Cronobacter dublinensis]EKF2281441.1 DUF2778 domain-containing protein [Cronobacter dublinensis]EKF2291713.1 DUF2778 domain-containing protein [Cronobacter dublinensis]EKF2294872.1 DUF2778 domain-containing protein [Cronobacter dublinensis]EKF2297121.1 DUF2778 domain-containing protein [Cronobacter dublinensis]